MVYRKKSWYDFNCFIPNSFTEDISYDNSLSVQDHEIQAEVMSYLAEEPSSDDEFGLELAPWRINAKPHHFEIQKRFPERAFPSSAEDIYRLRQCIAEKVRSITAVSPDHFSVRVDAPVKDHYKFFIAHINFTSCEAGVCGAMELRGRLNSFRPEEEEGEVVREVLSCQIRFEY